MKIRRVNTKWMLVAALPIGMLACKKDDAPTPITTTITVENVLNSKPLVQSGTFKGTDTPPVILPGQSVTISFSAAKGQAISFATMYGWSNDLFFGPANPGIQLYDAAGNPVQGDVSAQIKLWDNGTRVNQAPGTGVTHPGVAETKNITEVSGTDAQGNTYLAASALMQATLVFNGNSSFTLTLKNTSGGTANETPFSPGVWGISYVVGGNLLNAAPLYTSGQPTANGLTDLAEMGDNSKLGGYIQGITGIFTPLSPVLVVVYNGINDPIFKVGEKDRGNGLRSLAQKGDADDLAASLKTMAGVKAVYVLPAANTTVLLPMINGVAGGSVSQQLSVNAGDRIAIASMYGFSNDWFFSTADGIDATQKGDLSSSIGLYDNGTAVNQFPGAGGVTFVEDLPITVVLNPNAFTTLPAINNIIKVTLQ